MPYRTRYGKHYHEVSGCHGATIPCGTAGLSPCSDCCGDARGGGGSQAQDAPSTGMPVTGEETGAYEAEGLPHSETPGPAQGEAESIGESPAAHAAGIAEAGRQAMAGGQAVPSVEVPEGALSAMMAAGGDATQDAGGDEAGDTTELVDRDGNPYKVEGLGYEGRGQGWPKKRRGKRYYRPGGEGYSYMTRKQAGIVYGAVKRGDLTLDRQHVREMYDLVGTPWSDMDVRERSIFMHVGSAIDHLFAGRKELAQAELDGHHVEERQRVIGTRAVEVTEDNWLDFAFDFDHDYEVGDMAEEEVTETFWEITDGSWN